MYLDAIRVAEDIGFEMYMFDHFAVPGYESTYNEWTFKKSSVVEVLGVGPGAYGFVNNYRIGTSKDVAQYIAAVERGEHLITSASEQLTGQTLRERYVINLLQYFAVDFKAYTEYFASDFLEDFRPAVRRLLAKGLATVDRDRLVMTDLGKEWRMNVMLEFANEAFFAGWSQGAEDRQLAGFDPGDIRLKILMILVMGPADVPEGGDAE